MIKYFFFTIIMDKGKYISLSLFYQIIKRKASYPADLSTRSFMFTLPDST